MELKILQTYTMYRQVLDIIEQGDWQNNVVVKNLTVENVEHMRFIVEEFEHNGFRKQSN